MHPSVDAPELVVASRAMTELIALAERAAESSAKVLITGESGVGKDLIARHVHSHSPRRQAPFVAVNCAGLTESLLESELFGHVKGSFTGAYRDKRGKLQLAHRGTLFLDEVGEMSLRMQALLLRFLENGEIQRVGADHIRSTVDVRVVAATNRNLSDMVANGQFREDLLYRLRVIHVHVPPLRERKEDIVPLVEHFLKKCRRQMKKEVKGVMPEALSKMMFHDWPGNVRELENCIEYAVAMTQKDMIGEDHILQTNLGAANGARVLGQHHHARADERLKPLKDARDAFERSYLVQVLSMTEGNVSQAAKLAGKYRADLYDLLKKHDLRVEDFKKTKAEMIN
jgi:two-component system response regulator GlrR